MSVAVLEGVVELACIVTVAEILDVLFTNEVNDADIAVEFFVVNSIVVFGAILEPGFKVVIGVVFIFVDNVSFLSVVSVVSLELRIVWGYIVWFVVGFNVVPEEIAVVFVVVGETLCLV